MEKGKTDKLVSALVEKSKESAYLAVEIMNKPTIHYRTEGFCFFICNAWELLLKAFLIRERGSASIELPSKDGTPRTKGLSQCIDDVFTSTDNAVKSNLVLIVRMRNRATHLVASSDDKKYAPGFQSCVSNFFQFLKRHFPDRSSLDMTPFISLAVGTAEEREPVLIEPELSDFFQADGASFEPLLKGKLFITKKEADADFTAHIGKEGEHGLIKVEVPKDTKTTHPYTQTTAVKKIKELISANGLPPEIFNKYSFGRIKKDLALVDNQTYCYKDTHYQAALYYYSQAAIDLIASRFVSDEEFRERYKARS